MELKTALSKLDTLEETMQAYSHAMGVLSLDGATAAPKRSALGRGKTFGVLGGITYQLLVNDEVDEMLRTILSNRDGCTPAQARRSSGGGSSSARAMTSEERLDYDRRRAEMVRDVLVGAPEETPGQAGSDESEATRSIDLSAVGSTDGIISSLDDDFEDAAVQYEGAKRPFRCMFVKDQKLKSGQRVTLRLLEDYNADGIRIPANTHLAAICKIGDRLELQVRSLEMNGRIIPLALDAYDTDGLQGIYCPETSASKSAKQAGNDAISTAGTTFGGLVGDLASTVIRTGASIARSASGELSVSVVSGYEFYLVKSERR